MSLLKRIFPFNAEQTINIASEFGPLVTMFVVNAAYGINAGTWALITTTCIAIAAMFWVFGRPPIFPLIASTVTVAFGTLTLVTGDPMWVQIKVTIFNALFAGVLFGGLYSHEERGHHWSMWAVVLMSIASLAGTILQIGLEGGLGKLVAMYDDIGVTAVFKHLPQLTPIIALIAGFLIGAALLKRNFFQYVFERTFHFTDEGWDKFTWSFAWFFVLTAVANEAVRLSFTETEYYNILGWEMDGVNVWIMFKILIVMPASGLYAWILSRNMHKYRLPDPGAPGVPAPTQSRETPGKEFSAIALERPAPRPVAGRAPNAGLP